MNLLDLDLTSGNLKLDELKKIPKCIAVISCLGSRKGGIRDSWNIEYLANKNLLNFAQKLIAINLFYCQQFVFRNQGFVSEGKTSF